MEGSMSSALLVFWLQKILVTTLVSSNFRQCDPCLPESAGKPANCIYKLPPYCRFSSGILFSKEYLPQRFHILFSSLNCVHQFNILVLHEHDLRDMRRLLFIWFPRTIYPAHVLMTRRVFSILLLSLILILTTMRPPFSSFDIFNGT